MNFAKNVDGHYILYVMLFASEKLRGSTRSLFTHFAAAWSWSYSNKNN